MTNAERITRALGGHWNGSYGTAMCPAHENSRTPALSLANGFDGKLLMKCHAGCNFSQVAGALKNLGFINTSVGHKAAINARFPCAQASPEQQRQRNASYAQTLWQQADTLAGTQGEAYLKARGLSVPLTDGLRYHPSCWHGPSQRYYPAILALITGGRNFALHRIYLSRREASKANVLPNKMMLGAAGGGAVRLSMKAGPLILAEGIETALSLTPPIIEATGAIWAALSTSGLISVDLPAHAHHLIIAADGDPPGQHAAQKLMKRAQALGWLVTIRSAPAGMDWNDVLMKKVYDK